MRSDLPTAPIQMAPIVLVVGCPPALVQRCTDAAIGAQSLVVEADVASATTMAAQTRPLVIVLLDDVYAFDAASFNALASDVRAKLVVLSGDELTDDELESMLASAIGEAEAKRDSFA